MSVRSLYVHCTCTVHIVGVHKMKYVVAYEQHFQVKHFYKLSIHEKESSLALMLSENGTSWQRYRMLYKLSD